MIETASPLSAEDTRILIKAFDRLEHASFAVKLTNVVGMPVEMTLKLLPSRWYQRFHQVAEACMGQALDTIISNKDRLPGARVPGDLGHKILGMAVGAAGGFIGGPALLLELPVATSVMLSAITEIAEREGEDMDSMDARLACLQVFALGGRTDEDDAADTGYYGLRLALEVPVAEASRYLSRLGHAAVNRGKPPALVELLNFIARRFGLVLSEKAAAQMVPLIGAVAGAAINHMFIEHFQNIAKGHFSLRRMERTYGSAVIQENYARLRLKSRGLPILANHSPSF